MLGSDLHKAALALAAKGIPVFPCLPGKKQPAVPGGFYAATTDVDTISRWWAIDDYNVAFSPGMVGQTVLDSDPKHGGDWTLEAKEREHGSIDTYTVQTPSGGFHFYFAGATPRCSAGRLGAGLDTRSERGYVLVPPSRTDDGTYSVVVDAPFKPTPDWIRLPLETSRSGVLGLDVEPDLEVNIQGYREWLARQPGVAAGERNDTASTIIGYALDYGLSKETALPIIYEWGARCTPPIPYPDDKIENHGIWLKRQNTGAPMALTSAPVETWSLGELPPEAEGFRTFGEDEQDEWEEPVFLIPDLFPEIGIGAFYGSKGTFKSFLALHLALGLCVAGHAVVYVPYEGAVATGKIRRPAYKAAHGITRKLPGFHIVGGKQRPFARDQQSVIDFVEGVRPLHPKLIVFDTLHRFMRGLSEIKDDDCSKALDALQFISEQLQCCVLVCHHKPKGGETKGTMRGHSSLTDDMDFVHEVMADRKAKIVELWARFMKDADEREKPWCYELRPSLKSLALHEVPQRPGLMATGVAHVMSEKGLWGEAKGVTTTALASWIREPTEGETPEEADRSLKAVVKDLTWRAMRDLSAYCYGEGTARRWWLKPMNE